MAKRRKNYTKQEEELFSTALDTPTPKRTVIIYTDGACLKNPGGAGGWAAVLQYTKGNGELAEKEILGGDPSTTNNRMEMQAAIEALKALKEPCCVKLHSDSQLLVNTMSLGWKRKANKDLWAELDKLSQIHKVEWVWVKGHASDPLNNRADELAVQAAMSADKQLAGE